jgi:hypothetical protein
MEIRFAAENYFTASSSTSKMRSAFSGMPGEHNSGDTILISPDVFQYLNSISLPSQTGIRTPGGMPDSMHRTYSGWSGRQLKGLASDGQSASPEALRAAFEVALFGQ